MERIKEEKITEELTKNIEEYTEGNKSKEDLRKNIKSNIKEIKECSKQKAIFRFLVEDVSIDLKCIYYCLLRDRKSTRLNSSHTVISYAVFCLKKKKN